ncbi:MAG: class II fructose-bisphosphate aldolase [Synergistaceae bacterium]|jgi:ketose-bisphosphate aldolase|nr:class II fructose-bisphosphate aldolase [Synergistaceae bacterium]
MPNVKAKDILKDAAERGYCVGYFESWDLESTAAVVRAAEKMRSPVMIGFCGEYLASPERKYAEDIRLYGTFLKEMARSSSAPTATLLNESTDIKYAYKGIGAGFDMVMFVDEEMRVERLTDLQKHLVEFAHSCDVSVEAELGVLPTANRNTSEMSQGLNTDPELAARFVAETGIDALAVAIGNVHLLEWEKAEIDLELLEKIHDKVSVPLVLHGGTGIDKSMFREAAARGIAKVNVGAGMKRVVINSYKRYFEENDVSGMNPNLILGRGGGADIQRLAHDELVDFVAEFIKAFQGENKAR